MDKSEYIGKLLVKYNQKQLTEEEHRFLEDWANSNPSNQIVFDEFNPNHIVQLSNKLHRFQNAGDSLTFDAFLRKNKINNKARIVAGYCWPWTSRTSSEAYDIIFLEYNFEMRWNRTSYGGKFMIDLNSVTEIGCIHTAQGLEADYIGVIIGNDLLVRNGEVLVQPAARDKNDRTIFGYKKLLKENPIEGKELIKAIIKNTYRTLMTRGMKGCYIYCTDAETNAFFKKQLEAKQ